MKQHLMPYIELDPDDLAALQAGQPFIVKAGGESVILRFNDGTPGLSAPMLSSNGTHAYKCKLCQQTFPIKQALAHHVRFSHPHAPHAPTRFTPKGLVKTFHCQFCSWKKKATSPGVVANHLRREHPTKIKGGGPVHG